MNIIKIKSRSIPYNSSLYTEEIFKVEREEKNGQASLSFSDDTWVTFSSKGEMNRFINDLCTSLKELKNETQS